MNVFFVFFLIYALSISVSVLIISYRQKRSVSRVHALHGYIEEQNRSEMVECREEKAARMVLSELADFRGSYNSHQLLADGEYMDLHQFRKLTLEQKCLVLQSIDWNQRKGFTEIIVHSLKSGNFYLQYFALKLLQRGFSANCKDEIRPFFEHRNPILQREAIRVLAYCT